MKKCIAILLILTFVSCQKDEAEKARPKPFDISNVKDWYLSKTANSKLNGDDPKLKKEIMWNQATNGKHFDGSAVWIMPIKYVDETVRLNLLKKNKGELNKVKFKDKDELKCDNVLEYLTIKKNGIGGYEIENVITAEYKEKKKKEDFEGLFYVFDGNNKFKTGFLIENNKVKYIFSETKNAKIANLVCNYMITTTFYSFTVTVGNNTAGPYNNGYTSVITLGCYYDNQNSGPYVSYSGTVLSSSGSSSGNSGISNSFLSKDIINNLELKSPCAYNMVEYIRNNYIINGIINSFNQNAPFQKFLYLIEAGNTNNGQNAITEWNGPNGIKTILNQDYLNTATKLSIFRTIVHETIHAYIIASNKTNGDFQTTYPQAWQDFLLNKDTNQAHHIAMMTNWRDRIAFMLQLWDGSRNDIQYYKDLSWGGIAIPGSQYFEQFVPYLYERDRIFNRLSNEASGIGGDKCN